MNTDCLKDILSGHQSATKKKRMLRRYARAVEKMRSTLAVLHTWCKHDPAGTTHNQIVGIIDATLDEVAELEAANRKDRA
jgi:hypothetical protein